MHVPVKKAAHPSTVATFFTLSHYCTFQGPPHSPHCRIPILVAQIFTLLIAQNENFLKVMLQKSTPGNSLSLITGFAHSNQKEGFSLPFAFLCVINIQILFIYCKLIRITTTAKNCQTIFVATFTTTIHEN